MPNYGEAINLQKQKSEYLEQLQTSESVEETHRIIDLMEDINRRIIEALDKDTTIAYKMYD